jgi:hypothetical protein
MRVRGGRATASVDLSIWTLLVRRHHWDDSSGRQGAESVKYMLLFIRNEETILDDAAQSAHYAAIDEWFAAIGRDGKLRGGEELQPSNTATTIRFQEGRPLVTDGPFMESKENVAGFVTIDVADLDDAIAIAKQWPPKDQAVEIRPVVNHEDMPHHPVG